MMLNHPARGCSAGSLVIFCPFTLHTGSANRGQKSRYVCVQSFYHHEDSVQVSP